MLTSYRRDQGEKVKYRNLRHLHSKNEGRERKETERQREIERERQKETERRETDRE